MTKYTPAPIEVWADNVVGALSAHGFTLDNPGIRDALLEAGAIQAVPERFELRVRVNAANASEAFAKVQQAVSQADLYADPHDVWVYGGVPVIEED
jgi:hypothetical protein